MWFTCFHSKKPTGLEWASIRARVIRKVNSLRWLVERVEKLSSHILCAFARRELTTIKQRHLLKWTILEMFWHQRVAFDLTSAYTDIASWSMSRMCGASVDALYRDGTSEISRDPRTKRLKTRWEWLPIPSKHTSNSLRAHIYLYMFPKTSYAPSVVHARIRSYAISRFSCHHILHLLLLLLLL